MKRSDRRKRLSELADVSASLRSAPIEAPDFTSSILDRVDAERAFLAPSVRRKIHVTRWALGASVALLVLGVALTVRLVPATANVAGAPTPISAVVRTVENNADMNLDGLRQTIDSVTKTEPAQVISAVTAFAAVSRAVEFESPAEAPTSLLASGKPSPVFTGPVLPIATAMSMEPASPAASVLPQVLAKWPSRSAQLPTSDVNAIMIRERQSARAALDRLSSGTAPTLFEHEADGLPIIR